MMTSMLILSLAYALVAALLLTLCITLPGKRGLKISLIALVSVFYAVTWIGHQSMLGWPTSEDMPVDFRVLWITIDEPDKVTREPGGIFFWVRALDEAGIPKGTPRAHRIPFTQEAAEEAQAAIGKMEEGDVMNGTLSRNSVRDKDQQERDGNRYEGTELVSGDDGFRPMFELRAVNPPTLPPKA